MLFCCKNAGNGVGQNVGQLPDPHRDPHNEMCGKSQRAPERRLCLLSGIFAPFFCLHDLRHEAAHRLCCLVLLLPCSVGVGAECESSVIVAEHTADGFDVHPILQCQRCEGVPLRYNNDKQKKPLFSRGLSVCRLLFNSFSKLKIDENYKEKRRLFY